MEILDYTKSPRISDADTAIQLCTQLEKDDAPRSLSRAKTKGMIDGNAPYKTEDLKSLGQGWMTNLNFREGESILTAAKAPYYDLMHEVQTFTQADTEHGTIYEKDEYNKIIAEKFHNMIVGWEQFDFHKQLSQKEMCAYGTGLVMWDDEHDWRFKAIRTKNVLVPNETLANLDDLELFVIKDRYRIHQLYRFIQDEKIAKDLGWNIKLIKQIIQDKMHCHRSNTTSSTISWEECQDKLKRGDVVWGTCLTKPVDVFQIFSREKDGSITRQIVCRGVERPESGIDTRGFIFEKVKNYEDFSHIICPYFYDIGDGDWHSIRGIAQKMYPALEVKNRLQCRMVDGAFLSSNILIQPMDQNAMQRAQLQISGGVAIVPPGYNAVTNGFPPVHQNAIPVVYEMGRILMGNTAQYKQRGEPDYRGEPPTATQVNNDVMERTKLQKSDINRWYTSEDKFWKEIYRRATSDKLTKDMPGGKEAKAFIKACVDLSVPMPAIKKCKVTATRSIGGGSEQVRTMKLRDLVTLSPSFPEAGRINLFRDLIGAVAGRQAIDRYFPIANNDTKLQEQVQKAMLENGVMKSGSSLPAVETDYHVTHSQVHMKEAFQTLDLVQQGQADPVQSLNYLKVGLGPHLAMHLQMLAPDPQKRNDFQMLNEQFTALSKATDNLEGVVQQMMQQAQQQQQQPQQPSPEEMAALLDIEKKKQALELGEIKKAQAAQKVQQTEEKHKLNQRKTQQGMVIKDVETATKLNNQKNENRNVQKQSGANEGV